MSYMKRHAEALGLLPLAATTCPYCEQELDGMITNGLHAACNIEYNRELQEWEKDRPGLIIE